MERITNYKEGFCKGYGQLQIKDKDSAYKELWSALGVSSRTALSQYRRGKIEPKASQAEAVEKVFKKYGITEIWGK
jgi:transcriptional regulator with XRE-family HTH domain